MKLFQNPRRTVFLIGLVLVFFATLFGVMYFINSSNTGDTNLLAIVGSEKIYKSDLARKAYAEGLTGDLTNPNLADAKGYDKAWKEQTLETLIEEAGIRQLAAKEGVEVTDNEVIAEASKLKEYKKLTKEQLSVFHKEIKANLLLEKVKSKVLTAKKGRYVVIRFDKHMTIDSTLPETTKQARQATQTEDVKKDRAYADSLKDTLYNQLTSKAITFEQAMETVRNDKYIDWQNYDFTISDPAVNFDTANSPVGFKIGQDVSFEKVINQTSKGTIATPFLRKLNYAEDGKPDDYKDSMWVILTVDEEYSGKTINFEEWLETEINKLGVTNKNRITQLINKYVSEAYAYNPSGCSTGRTNQSNSHPADVIINTRYVGDQGGSGYDLTNTRAYIRPSSTAEDYTGCPEPDFGEDHVVAISIAGDGGQRYFYESENANDDSGCIYRFSSLANSPINQCCGDSHNAHVIALRYESASSSYVKSHGQWHHYYIARSDGSDWSAQKTEDFTLSGIGDSNSGRIVTNVYNGETTYVRGVWQYQVNLAPTISGVAPTNNASFESTDTITLTTTATDENTVPTYDKVDQKISLSRSSDNGQTWSSVGNYSTGLSTQGQKNIKTFNPGELSEGLYRWVASATDEHDLDGNSQTYYFSVGTNPPPPIPGCSCDVQPATGIAPLVTRVNVTSATLTAPWEFLFRNTTTGATTTLTGPSPYIYTFPSAGNYSVTVRHPGTGTSCGASCLNSPITVTDPSNGGGNEVTP